MVESNHFHPDVAFLSFHAQRASASTKQGETSERTKQDQQTYHNHKGKIRLTNTTAPTTTVVEQCARQKVTPFEDK